MGIPFPFTALPGRKKGKDAFSLLPSHRLEPEGVCVCVCCREEVYVWMSNGCWRVCISCMVSNVKLLFPFLY